MAASDAGSSNVEIIFRDWLDAMRRGDLDAMRERLSPDVVHQGLKPDWVCRGRDQVLEQAGARVGNPPTVDALELIAADEHVIMSVRGPGVGVPLDDHSPPRGQACVVFTLRDGRITFMQDYLQRADALSATGARGPWD